MASESEIAGVSGINTQLSQRLAAYSKWKASVGITGKPTASQFRRFMGAHRPGSKGVTLYPDNTSGFLSWSRIAGKIHSHHGFPEQFADKFAKIGINDIDNYLFDLPASHHLGVVHKGSMGGAYNRFWTEFFEGQHGPVDASGAFNWLNKHNANQFVIEP